MQKRNYRNSIFSITAAILAETKMIIVQPMDQISRKFKRFLKEDSFIYQGLEFEAHDTNISVWICIVKIGKNWNLNHSGHTYLLKKHTLNCFFFTWQKLQWWHWLESALVTCDIFFVGQKQKFAIIAFILVRSFWDSTVGSSVQHLKLPIVHNWCELFW